MRKSALVVAKQTNLRAAVARGLLPLRYRVEIASTENAARSLLGSQRFAAAVIAPASLAADEVAFLHDVQDAVGKLVILAEDAAAKNRLATLFPEALLAPSWPLKLESVREFLADTAITSPAETPPDMTGRWHFGGCTLDAPGRIFIDAGRHEVALTRREFALLFAFVRDPGHCCPVPKCMVQSTEEAPIPKPMTAALICWSRGCVARLSQT